MVARSLPEKILTLDGALDDVPHAFGGAIALAYYAEPRATVDIDVNVFVPEADAGSVIEPLAAIGITADEPAVRQATADGQVRLSWDGTPVDLFFSYDEFHNAAEQARRRVPFADSEIPILGPEHLITCKVIFDRPQDWVDIAAIRGARTSLDAAEILRWTHRIVGDDDPRYQRIVGLLTSGQGNGATFVREL